MSDYLFQQRYDDLMYDEHTKGHPRSDAKNCDWCKGGETDGEEDVHPEPQG